MPQSVQLLLHLYEERRHNSVGATFTVARPPGLGSGPLLPGKREGTRATVKVAPTDVDGLFMKVMPPIGRP